MGIEFVVNKNDTESLRTNLQQGIDRHIYINDTHYGTLVSFKLSVSRHEVGKFTTRRGVRDKTYALFDGDVVSFSNR